jgi:hypothetical protein
MLKCVSLRSDLITADESARQRLSRRLSKIQGALEIGENSLQNANDRFEILMKTKFLSVLFLLATGAMALAQPSAGGIVYGPKGAFNLSAPKGWKLDPTAGSGQGLPCVLYPEGGAWETADPVMYAKIASTIYEDYEKFVKDAIEDMKKRRPGFKMKRVGSGKTAGGEPYFINEYPPSEGYKRWERVAYVQLPKAVAYIVFTADEKAVYQKQQGALEEAVKSLRSMNVDYPEKPK